MESWGKRVEILVDRIIPYAVFLLLIVVILQFTSAEFIEKYHLYIQYFDYAVIAVFTIDLVFKYRRVRHFKPFIRKYWLDLIAVFPFYLVIRVVEEGYLLLRFGEQFSEIQPLVHSGLEIERAISKGGEEAAVIAREGGLIAREAEVVAKEGKEVAYLSRTRFISKFLKPFSRIPRVAKAIAYYEEAEIKEKQLHNHLKKGL